MRVKVGCCGFPGGMEGYFREWRLVEVQQTFYQPPRAETAARWRQRAPADFEFTVKAWQLITHPPTSPTYRRARLAIPSGKEKAYGSFRPSPEVMAAWERTRQIARELRAKVVLFQCPASFTPTPENLTNLRRFFSSIGREFLFAWEPRGEWERQTILTLCRELGLTHCVDPFLTPPVYGEVGYFRLHGGPGYRHRYSDDELRRLKEMVGGRQGYLLFNNLTMAEDSRRFLALLHESP